MKPSILSLKNLLFGLASRTKAILNIRKFIYDCLTPVFTASMYTLVRKKTNRASRYRFLLQDWENHENDIDCFTTRRNIYINNIWQYKF